MFVVETVENAQPAEAAGAAVRFFNRRRKEGAAGVLSGLLRFAVLGLGDTNLLLDRQTTTGRDCNQAGATLDSALSYLGGAQVVERCEANDASGLSADVDPWTARLVAALRVLKDAPPAAAAAGVGSSDEAAPPSGAHAASSAELLVLFGSATGNSEEIARGIAAAAAAPPHGLAVACMTADDALLLPPSRSPLRPGSVLLFVVSSTGDGEPPENCSRFASALRRLAKPAVVPHSTAAEHNQNTPPGAPPPPPPPPCRGVQYAVLGLGDQNYSKFMAVPRFFSSRLDAAGAVPFAPRGEADDTEGTLDYVDAWTSKVWAPVKEALARAPALAAAAAAAAAAAPAPAAPAAAAPPAAVPAAAAAAATDAAAPPPPPPRDAAVPPPPTAAAMEGLDGVPPPQPPTLAVEWLPVGPAASAAASDSPPLPSGSEDDPSNGGLYSPHAPFPARLVGVELLTRDESPPITAGPASGGLPSPPPPPPLRRVLHLRLDTSAAAGRAARPQPGDSIGVCPRNDPAAVDELLSLLPHIDPSAPFRLRPLPPSPLPHHLRFASSPSVSSTVRRCLESAVDVSAPPRRAALRALADHCASPTDARRLLLLSSRGGRAAYNEQIAAPRARLADVLRAHPSCAPPWGVLLDAVLPPMAPRLYSVASWAPEEPSATTARDGSSTVSVALSVVRFAPAAPAAAHRYGVASGWLDRLAAQLARPGGASDAEQRAVPEDLTVPVFIRPGGSFAPPDDILSTPLIMIGPGTGVAPFRAFVQRRAAALAALSSSPPTASSPHRSVAPAWLFFGCRSDEEDFLFKSDLEGWAADGTLTKLLVAFSRPPPRLASPKAYVQDRISEHAAALAALIVGSQPRAAGSSGGAAGEESDSAANGFPPARVYVCGDGAGMAKGVHAALVDALARHGGLAEGGEACGTAAQPSPAALAAATQLLDAMARDGRYVRELWSAVDDEE